MSEPVALSVRQPWAALIVAGAKLVEVRTWPTRRTGRVLIHAGKRADERPEGWARVTTPEVRALAELRGGIVGAAELVGCRYYDTVDEFAADENLHLNAPDWFAPPRLYGFEFHATCPLPFRRCHGLTMFFKVSESPGSPAPGL